MMLPRVLKQALLVGVVLGFAAACGLNFTGGPADSIPVEDVRPSDVVDAGHDPLAPGSGIAVFPCGTETCTPGVHACCASASTFTCRPLDASCALPDEDSGAPPPPPLLCTSSAGCAEDSHCCYDAIRGSACRKSCPPAGTELCRLDVVGKSCGEDADCVAMKGAPAPGIGGCQMNQKK